MDALPRGRTIPIRGDVVRTGRLAGHWASLKHFATDARLSEDRLKEIERGGARVYAQTLLQIAKTLKIHWNELVEPVTPALVEADKPVSSSGIVVRINLRKRLEELADTDQLSDILQNIESGIDANDDILLSITETDQLHLHVSLSRDQLVQLIRLFSTGWINPGAVESIGFQVNPALTQLVNALSPVREPASPPDEHQSCIRLAYIPSFRHFNITQTNQLAEYDDIPETLKMNRALGIISAVIDEKGEITVNRHVTPGRPRQSP